MVKIVLYKAGFLRGLLHAAYSKQALISHATTKPRLFDSCQHASTAEQELFILLFSNNVQCANVVLHVVGRAPLSISMVNYLQQVHF